MAAAEASASAAAAAASAGGSCGAPSDREESPVALLYHRNGGVVPPVARALAGYVDAISTAEFPTDSPTDSTGGGGGTTNGKIVNGKSKIVNLAVVDVPSVFRTHDVVCGAGPIVYSHTQHTFSLNVRLERGEMRAFHWW